ncbi:MAG: DNA-protecting protein DprA [Nitriliruptorales bacterium]|nr:DNA-protecting protein DprA [Nitriliruptorales bacterium]
MSAPAWAEELGPGLDAALVVAVVSCAVSPWATPEALRRVLAARLERGAATGVEDVVAELAHPPLGAASPEPAVIERAARTLLAVGARVVVAGCPGYPPALVQTWPELGAPAWLFVRPAPPPAGPCVAVVGTRRASLDGLRTARALGAFLAERGVGVVSGLARGIDQAAHQGALDRAGVTVGVLGTGFGVDYPRGDGRLRAAVSASGGLVTEYAVGAPPRPPHFLWRNRIISGLASVVVVVEGRARSGALQTARLAAAQGRDVFAVPGSLNAATSRGPLDLIRDGACVLTAFDDVLQALDSPAWVDHRQGVAATALAVPAAGGQPGPAPAGPAAGLEHEALVVLDLLGSVPSTPGQLAARARLPIATTLAVLGALEQRGLAAHTARGFVTSARAG